MNDISWIDICILAAVMIVTYGYAISKIGDWFWNICQEDESKSNHSLPHK